MAIKTIILDYWDLLTLFWAIYKHNWDNIDNIE